MGICGPSENDNNGIVVGVCVDVGECCVSVCVCECVRRGFV